MALCAGLAFGQETNELELIRQEMRVMRADYEQRMRALEERLRRAEMTAGATNGPSTNAGMIAGPATTTMQALGAGTNVMTLEESVAQGAAGVEAYRNRGSFGRTTESREIALAARQEEAFKQRVEHVLEDFVEITGYFRAGYGESDRGGPMSAFQAPGAFAKYRLGNEAEVYGELGFAKNFYLPNIFSVDPKQRADAELTGPVARVQLLLSAYNPYEDLLTASGTDFGLPEAWASVGNVIPTQPSAKFWAGTRFYRRHDIHINDFYFYNMSGAGGGLEDVQFPFGKFAVAWIGAGARSGFSDVPEPDPENRAGFSKANLDFRLYDVPIPFGKGEFGVALARTTSGRDAEGRTVGESEGIALNALHIRDHFLSYDGINKFSLQFGTGPAKTFTSGFETFTLPTGVFIRRERDDSWRFRVTEHFTANLNTNFSIGPALIYQLTDYADGPGKVHWASAGVRPIVHFNRYVSLAFEGGVDWVRDEGAHTSDYLYKLTMAPQVSLGDRFMSRPVLRLFMTYAHWGSDFEGKVGGPDYVDAREGWSYGLQMEAWW